MKLTQTQSIAKAADDMLTIRDRINEYETTLLRCAEHPTSNDRAERAVLVLKELLMTSLESLEQIAGQILKP